MTEPQAESMNASARFGAVETQLEQVEISYIRLGLQYHCLFPSSDWPLKHVKKVRGAFRVDEETYTGTVVKNTLIEMLQKIHKQLETARKGLAGGQFQGPSNGLDEATASLMQLTLDETQAPDVETILNEALVSIEDFKTKMSDVESALNDLTAMSGLQNLVIDQDSNPSSELLREQGFRANKALWSWVMELPLVKKWIKELSVTSEEHAFVKAVCLGDVRVKRALLWMAG